LQQHPDILAFNELFHPDVRERSVSHAIRKNAAAIYFDPSIGTALEFLENWVWCSSNDAYSAVGFKLFGDYLKHPSTEGLFVKLKEKIDDLHVVHIKRLNYLDVYTSKMMASKTGVWLKERDVRYTEQVQEQDVHININPKMAEEFFISMVEVDGFLERHFGGGKYLPVYYEKIASDLQSEANRIFDFLGVSEKSVSAHLKKQIKRPKQEIIDNYEELFSYFADTPFASYFTN
jgi:hypothetical protein